MGAGKEEKVSILRQNSNNASITTQYYYGGSSGFISSSDSSSTGGGGGGLVNKSISRRRREMIVIGAAIGIVGVVAFISIPSNVVVEQNSSVLLGRSVVVVVDPSKTTTSHIIDITIPQGEIRGYLNKSRQGRNYFAFFKVPYAEPPIGNLRFKDPQPPPKKKSWDGLRDNPQIGPQCIQNKKYAPTIQATGEEDCLYANIYTPKISSNNKRDELLLPVMVFFHGGGYIFGTTDYGGTYFMDEDVVLVTFEFRLGPFGWLSTGDAVIPGNMGQKDQIQMLKWIKENIKYFGGNPDLVTIFGSSAGALFVSHLLLSPSSEGLFHRAISQSGSSLCPVFYDHNVKITMEAIGKRMDCDSKDSQEFWECLVDKDAGELAMLQGDGITYSTLIDSSKIPKESTFLPDIPLNLIQSGKMHRVPYIIGNVNAEYYTAAIGLLQNADMVRQLNDNFEEMSVTLLGSRLDAGIMKKVKEFYFGDNNKAIGNETFYELGDLISDWDLLHCSYLTARYHAAMGVDAYLYYMTKVPRKSNLDKVYPGFPAYEMGIVAHGDELQYLFPYGDGYFPQIPEDDPDYFLISRDWIKLWVHFAKTGGNNYGNLNKNGVEWTKVNKIGDGSANSTFRLELNDKMEMTRKTQDRMAFWDQFDIRTELHYGGSGGGNTFYFDETEWKPSNFTN